jgi:5-methylcytosine-specific restriction endonuclease McrA
LLSVISGRTKLKIREILAHRFPQAGTPTTLKRLPSLDPLAPGLYRLMLTLSAAQKRKLELARDLLSHANPNGDLGVVLERALDELILRLGKRRLGRVSRAVAACGDQMYGSGEVENAADDDGHDRRVDERGVDERGVDERGVDEGGERGGEAPVARKERSRKGAGAEQRRGHIRHDVRRELLARDGFRCAFVSEAGVRCDARAFLQFHHRYPWARGGSDSADNLELLCRSHNRLLAERDFGCAHVDKIIAKRAGVRQQSEDVRQAAESNREVVQRARRRRQS